jgi:hypothetical protein
VRSEGDIAMEQMIDCDICNPGVENAQGSIKKNPNVDDKEAYKKYYYENKITLL